MELAWSEETKAPVLLRGTDPAQAFMCGQGRPTTFTRWHMAQVDTSSCDPYTNNQAAKSQSKFFYIFQDFFI